MNVPGHLTIPISELQFEKLLADWRWLVPEKLTPVLMTAFGDLFLRDELGRIHFLDLMAGEFKEVAVSQEEFDHTCGDREQRRTWFLGFLVTELRSKHDSLLLNQCYSCKVPLTLGGQIEAGNFEPTDLEVHYSILGQLQRQTKRLPAGTKIQSFKTETSEAQTKQKSLWQRFTKQG